MAHGSQHTVYQSLPFLLLLLCLLCLLVKYESIVRSPPNTCVPFTTNNKSLIFIEHSYTHTGTLHTYGCRHIFEAKTFYDKFKQKEPTENCVNCDVILISLDAERYFSENIIFFLLNGKAMYAMLLVHSHDRWRCPMAYALHSFRAFNSVKWTQHSSVSCRDDKIHDSFEPPTDKTTKRCTVYTLFKTPHLAWPKRVGFRGPMKSLHLTITYILILRIFLYGMR